jgi:hypothetical protein
MNIIAVIICCIAIMVESLFNYLSIYPRSVKSILIIILCIN